MINWEIEDKTIHISKDGIASEQNYYKYKDWVKWERIDGNSRSVGITMQKAPCISFVADNERAALLKMLEQADRLRRTYSDLTDEIMELLEMEGNDK